MKRRHRIPIHQVPEGCTLKPCDDCGVLVISPERWCEDCFDRGLKRDMDEFSKKEFRKDLGFPAGSQPKDEK